MGFPNSELAGRGVSPFENSLDLFEFSHFTDANALQELSGMYLLFLSFSACVGVFRNVREDGVFANLGGREIAFSACPVFVVRASDDTDMLEVA